MAVLLSRVKLTIRIGSPAVWAVRVEAGHGARAAGGAAVDETHPAALQGA